MLEERFGCYWQTSDRPQQRSLPARSLRLDLEGEPDAMFASAVAVVQTDCLLAATRNLILSIIASFEWMASLQASLLLVGIYPGAQ